MGILATILPLIIMLGLASIVIVLQVYLSKTDSKFPGLILPIISLVLSLMITIGIVSFMWMAPSTDGGTTTLQVEDSEYEDSEDSADFSDEDIFDEEQTEETVFGNESREIEEGEQPSTLSAVTSTIGILLISNIPTVILMVIYIVTRKRLDKEKRINRTRIQDL
ncbi:hypothetical protein [Marinilactibacillus kalidii]|uniref:hypothetical protein n=1 Tax=Marinilactibacillus kalidii TaxID=2820274 RepID=UPI001ABDA883|nr:hypothetical protein [Marinilactibacillus kalidii]